MAASTATLSAVFKAIDNMSDVMDRIASAGSGMVSQWDSAGSAADQAFASAVSGAGAAASAMDNAAASQDNWTQAVGYYSKEALEAVYTTEDLVEMGFKSEEALNAAANAAEENTSAMEKGMQVMEGFRMTIQSQEEELNDLQEGYMGVVLAMGQNSDEAAALKEEIESLSAVLEENVAELGNLEQAAGKTGERGVNSIQQLQNVLVTAGVAKLVKEITDSFMECADAAMMLQTSVAKVSTLVDTSQVSMASIRTEVRSLSNDMGMASDQILEATYQAISGSVQAADAVQFVAEASMLAMGGFTNSATAVDVLTTAVNAYGLSIEEVEEVSSMLITTQNLGKTSVDALASNLGKVIPVAAAYNVEMDNLSTAYAVLTKGGIETANATTYMRSMLNELGNTSSDVADILMNETGMSFSQMMDSGYSLADVLEILAATVDGDTTAFANLWGSQTAGLGAMSLFNAGADEFNATLVEMQNSSGAVAEAYDTMASTTETARSRMQTAHANMAASFGDTLLPALDIVYEVGASAFGWIADVIDDYPVISAVFTGLAVGLGVIAIAFGAYTIATTIATAVTAAFGVTSLIALWPLYLVAAAIAAVVAVAILIANAIGNANQEFNEMSATTKTQYEEIERLNGEYEETVRVHGETSDAAQELAARIEAEKVAFEATRMTMEEFNAANEKLLESHEKVVESFQSGMDEINKEEKNATALINKLTDLAGKTERTASEQRQMEAVVGRLNEQYPELALSIDDATGALNQNVGVVKELAKAQAEQQRLAQQYESYVDLLGDQLELEEQLKIVEQERAAAQERFDDASWWDRTFGQAKKDLDEITEGQELLQAALSETNALLDEHDEAFKAAEQACLGAADAIVDYETGLNRAVASVKSDLDTLMEAYDEAYEAARSSIDSTIGLFDVMVTKCEISTNDMIASWQSQVDYLELYTENLQKAMEYDIDPAIVATLSDGSEESAGYINAIVAEVERLEAAGEDTTAFVNQFNEAFQEVETAKDQFAGTVAEMETDFNNAMDEIQTRMEQAIDDMTMEEDAAAAAKDTIQAYVDQIKSMTGDAQSAAEGLAQATVSALSGKGGSAPIRGYAVGTMSAEPGLALVGEEGPELINFGGGEVVYTAPETSRILTGSQSIQTTAPEGYSSAVDAAGGGSSTTEKKITLDINGSGSIDVSGQYDEESLWSVMSSRLKPAIMGMIKQEILEEGDLSYEF